VISFLARIAGLGKVSDAILDIVKKIRAPIDKGLDKAVNWVVAQAKKLGKLLVDKLTGKANRTPQDIERDKQKAQRELPGKINAFLAGEPMLLRVRAQLMIWKLQYKLADLKLTEKGEKGKFVATVNPTFDVGDDIQVKISDSQLIIIINQVCKDTIENSGILKREATRQRNEEKTQADPTYDPTITSKGARSTLAFAVRLREREEANEKRAEKELDPIYKTPSNPRFIMGQDESGKNIEVSWRRVNSASDWNRVIENQPRQPLPYLGKGGLAGRLPPGKKTVEALETVGKGGKLPKKVKDAQAVGEMSALIFGQEVARSPENVALAGMALDMKKEKNLDTTAMVKMLPAGPTGASQAQRDLVEAAKKGEDLKKVAKEAKERGDAKAKKLAKEARKMGPGKQRDDKRKAAKKARAIGEAPGEVLKRTVKLMTDWIRSKLKSGGPATKTEKGFINWLKKQIRDRVEQTIRKGN
jgi:hypothetical protein